MIKPDCDEQPGFFWGICYRKLSFDCRLTVRSERDDLDRHLQVVLHKADVLLECLRKFLLFPAACKVLVPSLELSVNRSYFAFRIERELVCLLSVIMMRSVTPSIITVYFNATRSSQPHLRGRPVTAPNS